MSLKSNFSKRALVTGAFGQDGSYLIELLSQKNYQVTALYYPNSTFPPYLEHLKTKVEFIPLDIRNHNDLEGILKKHFYDEIYNLAAVTFVPQANKNPLMVKGVNEDAVCVILDFLIKNNLSSRFFQATSAYIFDLYQPMPLTLESKIGPTEPYGISKAGAYFWLKFYRRYYNLYAVNGILFNHESPRRPGHFVIPKIIRQAVEIKKGLRKVIELGNINVARDWGWAPDYVQAMWLSLQQSAPRDVIIASGQAHRLTEVLDFVFDYLRLPSWQDYINLKDKLRRTNEVEEIYGDIRQTKKLLKWQPEMSFKGMLKRLIEEELKKNG